MQYWRNIQELRATQKHFEEKLVCAHCVTHLATHSLEALWTGAGGLGSRSGAFVNTK